MLMDRRSCPMGWLIDKSPPAYGHILNNPGSDLVLDGGASFDEDDIVEQPMRYYVCVARQ